MISDAQKHDKNCLDYIETDSVDTVNSSIETVSCPGTISFEHYMDNFSLFILSSNCMDNVGFVAPQVKTFQGSNTTNFLAS